MADLTLTVGGRAYRLACRDGEEEALRAAARRVDQVATDLAGSVGAVGESRLLLMAALSLAGASDAPPADDSRLLALAEQAEALARRLEIAAGRA